MSRCARSQLGPWLGIDAPHYNGYASVFQTAIVCIAFVINNYGTCDWCLQYIGEHISETQVATFVMCCIGATDIAHMYPY